jgi:hypothetical protein
MPSLEEFRSWDTQSIAGDAPGQIPDSLQRGKHFFEVIRITERYHDHWLPKRFAWLIDNDPSAVGYKGDTWNTTELFRNNTCVDPRKHKTHPFTPAFTYPQMMDPTLRNIAYTDRNGRSVYSTCTQCQNMSFILDPWDRKNHLQFCPGDNDCRFKYRCFFCNISTHVTANCDRPNVCKWCHEVGHNIYQCFNAPRIHPDDPRTTEYALTQQENAVNAMIAKQDKWQQAHPYKILGDTRDPDRESWLIEALPNSAEEIARLDAEATRTGEIVANVPRIPVPPRPPAAPVRTIAVTGSAHPYTTHTPLHAAASSNWSTTYHAQRESEATGSHSGAHSYGATPR